jgi:hypothetical protein
MHSVVKDQFTTKHFKTVDGNKLLHSEDGPAVIWASGDTEYFVNGEYHRLDGPAIDYKNLKIWYCEGIRHRTDGAAWISKKPYREGYDKKYYYKGKIVDFKTDEEFDIFIRFKAFW